jgi:methyl-accepting chemotaxis protein
MVHNQTSTAEVPLKNATKHGQGERMPSNHLSRSNIIAKQVTVFDIWLPRFSSILATLKQLAGATEHDFLKIGSQMQMMYQRSITLSETARQLVEAASGERIRTLMDRLRQMLREMETYLEKAQKQNLDSCSALERVEILLKQVAEPLAGFKKMSKQLYILEVSVKIESTSLGDIGGEFLNLAQDIKKLSHQIKEKSSTVHDHRLVLSSVITDSMVDMHAAQTNQDTRVKAVMNDTQASLSKLEAVNEGFSELGGVISAVSEENSHNISEIVQSMQFHDIYRQQLEHVIEALEGSMPALSGMHEENTMRVDKRKDELISNIGDVCELQEAQLQFASVELYTAVASIVTNLRDIGTKQKQLGRDIYEKTGVIDKTSNTSFIDDVSQHMSSITNLLTSCASTNKELAGITKTVTASVDEITGFVADIEEIGHEITQIALNSRIKAACTGTHGASLSALSEEIGQLSNEAVQSADSIIASLTEIQAATGKLSTETDSNEKFLDITMSGMKDELREILLILKNVGAELISLIPQLQHKVNSFTGEIEKIASGIDVHERAKTMADEALGNLQQIFRQARELYPAGTAFKEELRRMAERYTMESERRIHESIAKKHGLELSIKQRKTEPNTTSSDSELGDNVDLF